LATDAWLDTFHTPIPHTEGGLFVRACAIGLTKWVGGIRQSEIEERRVQDAKLFAVGFTFDKQTQVP